MIDMKTPEHNLFSLTEHEGIHERYAEYMDFWNSLELPNDDQDRPKYLGIVNNTTGYYIGAAWLHKNNTKKIDEEITPKVIVTPKIENLDFVEMLCRAFEFYPAAEYFSQYYDVDFDLPNIPCYSFQDQLTPLLVIHYIYLMQKLTRRDLKRGYVQHEENLKAKIRGRIVLSKDFQKNRFNQRDDMIFCSFQEYTVDIPENRLLKKALLFSKSILYSFPAFQKYTGYSTLLNKINSLLTFFVHVSDEIEEYQIRKISSNKLYKDYGLALKVAKKLLRRFGNSISSIQKPLQNIPAFWIDMPRLYEVYVYSLLEKAYPGQVLFQVQGNHKTQVDFIKLDEKIIMDTKYKPRYDYSNDKIIDDIREISGYARDERILLQMGIDCKDATQSIPVIPCVVIYPYSEDQKPAESIFPSYKLLSKQKRNKISGFVEFYKIGVPLPTLC